MKKLNFRKCKFSLDDTIANSRFDYCKNLKWILIAPAVIFLIGIILFSTIGFNLGLDFTGGSVLTVYSNNGGEILKEDGVTSVTKYDLNNGNDYNSFKRQIEEVLVDCGLTGKIVFQTTKINIDELNVSEGQAVIVKYQNISGASVEEITAKNEEAMNALLEKFGYTANTDYKKAVVSGGVITASASDELLMKAFLAMLVAVVLILIYIAFRFEITSGLAAILALFHDLLIVTSLVLICRITINSSFIAALVTILGYSINNTIIIFDRIRENIRTGRFENVDNATIANISVKETMTRSVYTTLTTLVTILLVAIIGVPDIRDFALPIVFGIGAGFYSSVFITPGLWAIAFHGSKKKKEKKVQKKDEYEV